MNNHQSRKRLEGRIAVITGASRGIGRAVAYRFAVEGATVIAIARSVKALERLDDEIRAIGDGNHAILVQQDLAEHTKIDQIALAIYRRFGRLDMLVGNAAILGPLSPVQHIAPQDWDRVIAVNTTANFHLIRSFDPLLRQSDSGRVIFVTSGITARAFPYWGAYATSKTALEMIVKVYAGEVRKTKIRVNLIDPGAVLTNLRVKAFPGENPGRLPFPEHVTEAFVALASSECHYHGRIMRASDFLPEMRE